MARPLRFPFKKLVAFDQQMLDAIEAWRKDQSPMPNESDAIRIILRDWLIGAGYLKISHEEAGETIDGSG
jgi:hypothetical protein